MTRPIRFLSVVAVALLSACGADSGVGPTTTVPVDLATAFSEMSVPGLSAVASLAGSAYAPSLNGVPSGCSYSTGSQSFVCPAITSKGVTITTNYSLLDAAGHSLSQYDASTVASLRVRGTIAGAETVNGDIYNIDGQSDQTLSGLQSATQTLNGTSTLNASGTHSSSALLGPFTTHSTTTLANVVLPAHGSSSSYPSSGTITVDQVTSVAGSSVTSRIVMAFNGTSKVVVTLTVDGLTLPVCTIDLSHLTPSCG